MLRNKEIYTQHKQVHAKISYIGNPTFRNPTSTKKLPKFSIDNTKVYGENIHDVLCWF